MTLKKLWMLLLACLLLAAASSCRITKRELVQLGDWYRDGDVYIKQDEAEAVRLYGEACDRGAMKGCSRLGSMYETGKGVMMHLPKAAELFDKACDDGIGQTKKRACQAKARVSVQAASDEEHWRQLAQRHREACDGGSMIDCTELGLMYQNGMGVPKDDAKAAQLLGEACDAGGVHVSNCQPLGYMYQTGKGVPKDEAKAVELYRKACGGGLKWSCDAVGRITGVAGGRWQVLTEKDENTGDVRKRCDNGSNTFCEVLGGIYEKGSHGVTKDLTKAVELYRKTCDGGSLVGCFRLGSMYETGKGVTKDLAKAAKLRRKACDGGLHRKDKWKSVCRGDAAERYLATLPSRPPACLDFKALSVEAQEADATGIPGPACDTSHPLGARILCAYPEFRAAYKAIDFLHWYAEANATSEEPDLPEQQVWKSNCRDAICVCHQLAEELAWACDAAGASHSCP